MNPKYFMDTLLSELKPWAKRASGYREIVTRCKYCSDSRNPNQGHFYISCITEDEPAFYNCFKCPAQGLVTPSKLMEWGIYDSNFLLELTEHNKRVLKYSKNKKFNNNIIYRINNRTVTDDKLTAYKLKYINERLGTHLTYEDCIRLKILLNLGDLFRQNPNITPTRYPDIIDQIDSNFVGFISIDNAFVNFRNLGLAKVHKSIDKRYINYNIFNKFDNTQRFYTIPNQFDLFKPVELHIAEGAFDILSIYLNLRKDMRNGIFTSIGGNGYKGIIRYFLVDMMIPNLVIHIYPDNDIDRYTILDLAEFLRPFLIPVYMHRNAYKGEKDFGVPLNRIQETIERLV